MKTVFITGADRGVGYSLCECFLQGGWHVIAGQYIPAWPQLCELQKGWPQLDILPLDVSDTASVQAAAALCYDEKQPYIHSDENRFTLRDAYLREISW